MTHRLLGSWIHISNFINLENSFEFFRLDYFKWLELTQLPLHFQLIEPSNSNKFSKFMKLFG